MYLFQGLPVKKEKRKNKIEKKEKKVARSCRFLSWFIIASKKRNMAVKGTVTQVKASLRE